MVFPVNYSNKVGEGIVIKVRIVDKMTIKYIVFNK